MLRRPVLLGAVMGVAMGAASFVASPAQAGFLFAFEDGQLTRAELLSSLSNQTITVTGPGMQTETTTVVRFDDATSGANLIPDFVPPNQFTHTQVDQIISEVANDGNPGPYTLEGVGTQDVTYNLLGDSSLFLFVKAANWELVYHDQGAGEETFNIVDDCPSCDLGGTTISNLRVFHVVPLPAALPLLASALGGLGLVGWMRRRSSTAEPLAA